MLLSELHSFNPEIGRDFRREYPDFQVARRVKSVNESMPFACHVVVLVRVLQRVGHVDGLVDSICLAPFRRAFSKALLTGSRPIEDDPSLI